MKIISYLVPAILVPAGNPGNIQTLADLAKPGVEIGIGNPETVCVGLYAYEILEYNGLLEAVEPGAEMDQRDKVNYFIAKLKRGSNPENADKFLDFITSRSGQNIYLHHGFVPHERQDNEGLSG